MTEKIIPGERGQFGGQSGKGEESPLRIIAFDFDGTITTRDTFALFLRYWAGTFRWFVNIVRLLPVFIGYKLNRFDRHYVKMRVVRQFFAGADENLLNQRAQRFAEQVIPRYIRPKALAEIESVLRGETPAYIVSASISPYLRHWARGRGFAGIIACELKFTDFRATGELDGINCWGEGKLDKISSFVHLAPVSIAAAYGDSQGDLPLLHAAKVSHWRPFRL